MKIKPVIFVKSGEYGDFKWMLKQEKYKDCLFVFNENYENYTTSTPGGGNACIRNYNQYGNHNPPRAAGVITGSLQKGGFSKLDEKAIKYIDASIHNIKQLIKKYKYTTVYYSAEDESGLLGTSIFEVDMNVLKYITLELSKLNEN